MIKFGTFILFFFATTANFFAQNTDLDKQLGEQNAAIIEAQFGIYEDVEKTDYIRRVGNRLVAQLDNPLFDFEFFLVPDISPNAFAIPGGHVYITTGLIPILESEDELACIIGHEIIHANQRHAIKQIKKSILPRLLELPGNLLGIIDSELGEIFNVPIETSNALLFASYGRDFETEADKLGIELAAKAGYDPNAMITSLTRLAQAVEVATGNKEQKSYFNDHPYTPTRTSNIEKFIASIEWTKKEAISENFLMEFDDILFGNSPNKGVINKNKFLHPDLNFSIEFPENWDIDNQPSNVAAYNPDRQAAIYVTLDNPMFSAEEAGSMFLEKLDSKYKSKMIGSGVSTLNNHDSYMLSFKESTNTVSMYSYVLWIKLDDKLFKLMGIAPLEYEEDLEKTAMSLKSLSEEEKQSFIINKMKVIEAEKGELMEDINKRSDNLLNAELTLVINNKKENKKLKEEELVKVVKSFPYIPKYF